MQAYSNPERENDPHALPDLEIFYLTEQESKEQVTETYDYEMERGGAGYYYWHCFPGCLPDSDPIGPFQTEQDALEDARAYEWE